MKNNGTRDLRFIVGLEADDHEYNVNGVRYVVSSRFQKPFEKPKNPMMSERVNHYLSGDFAELTVGEHNSTIMTEYVCSTVGEEDRLSMKKINLQNRSCSDPQFA